MPTGVYDRLKSKPNAGLFRKGEHPLTEFKEGVSPWNKGKRTGIVPKSAFKKGMIPHNYKGRVYGRTYRIWNCMRMRCTKPSQENYKNYGGRGITVCERWMKSFDNFLKDMGECPPALTLDRINNDGNYEPSNCRWATLSQQQQNKRTLR